MKIKKFRIRPRLASAGRILKQIMSAKQLPKDIEDSLPDESEKFLQHVLPAAFYHTWSRDEMPPSFREVLKTAGHERPVAVSAAVATIGSPAEEYLSELLMNGETVRSQIVTALAEESADQSFQFLYRLLAEEAQGDDCEVSEPLFIVREDLLVETLELLEAETEGFSIDPAGHLSPRFTRVALAAWTPVSKKKKPALPPQKKRST